MNCPMCGKELVKQPKWRNLRDGVRVYICENGHKFGAPAQYKLTEIHYDPNVTQRYLHPIKSWEIIRDKNNIIIDYVEIV